MFAFRPRQRTSGLALSSSAWANSRSTPVANGVSRNVILCEMGGAALLEPFPADAVGWVSLNAWQATRHFHCSTRKIYSVTWSSRHYDRGSGATPLTFSSRQRRGCGSWRRCRLLRTPDDTLLCLWPVDALLGKGGMANQQGQPDRQENAQQGSHQKALNRQ